MPQILENDGSPEYLGAVLFADQQRWCQALELASHELGPEPSAVASWQAHAAYIQDLKHLAMEIMARDN